MTAGLLHRKMDRHVRQIDLRLYPAVPFVSLGRHDGSKISRSVETSQGFIHYPHAIVALLLFTFGDNMEVLEMPASRPQDAVPGTGFSDRDGVLKDPPARDYFFALAGGIITASMTWMTPFDAPTSVLTTFALSTITFLPLTLMEISEP